MRLDAALLALLLPLAATVAPGCGHRAAAESRVPAAPATVSDLDEFSDALNNLALLEPGSPERAAYRAALRGFLLDHLEEALADGRPDEALSSLEYAANLYTPAELREGAPDPVLVDAADRLYRFAARRGAERASFLSLALRQHFGTDAERAAAVESWKLLEGWIVRNSAFSTEPVLRHEELEQALEEVAATFPSPFVVRRLSDLYLARYEAARRAIARGDMGTAGRRRVEFTGYLLIRLYLRADDLQGAARSLEKLELDLPTRKLGEMVDRAAREKRNARSLLLLAEQFTPDEGAEAHTPAVYANQGWRIVGNLASRAVRAFPDDAYARVILARYLTREGLVEASIFHLEKAIDLKEDIFEAWEHLASLQQESLARLSLRDPKAATKRLDRVEAFHARAEKLWRDRPLRPGLPEAYHSVADGLYHAGEASAAEGLLERSLALEAVPDSLDLLATIDFKHDRFEEARDRYEALASLPYEDEMSQLRWEIRALAQLAEIAEIQGDTTTATRHMRSALRALNALLSSPRIRRDVAAEHYTIRGKLLFSLGESTIAMGDFMEAIRIAPMIPGVYADPLLYLVERGHYEEASQVYQRSLGQAELSEDLKVYFSLWMRELAVRQGRAPDAQVTGFLEGYQGEDWPRKLAAHALNKLSYDELLAAASDRGERTEAMFYEALGRWHGGDHKSARTLMKQVLDGGMMSFFEYEMAQSYLRWGKLPIASARATAAAE